MISQNQHWPSQQQLQPNYQQYLLKQPMQILHQTVVGSSQQLVPQQQQQQQQQYQTVIHPGIDFMTLSMLNQQQQLRHQQQQQQSQVQHFQIPQPINLFPQHQQRQQQQLLHTVSSFPLEQHQIQQPLNQQFSPAHVNQQAEPSNISLLNSSVKKSNINLPISSPTNGLTQPGNQNVNAVPYSHDTSLNTAPINFTSLNKIINSYDFSTGRFNISGLRSEEIAMLGDAISHLLSPGPAEKQTSPTVSSVAKNSPASDTILNVATNIRQVLSRQNFLKKTNSRHSMVQKGSRKELVKGGVITIPSDSPTSRAVTITQRELEQLSIIIVSVLKLKYPSDTTLPVAADVAAVIAESPSLLSPLLRLKPIERSGSRLSRSVADGAQHRNSSPPSQYPGRSSNSSSSLLSLLLSPFASSQSSTPSYTYTPLNEESKATEQTEKQLQPQQQQNPQPILRDEQSSSGRLPRDSTGTKNDISLPTHFPIGTAPASDAANGAPMQTLLDQVRHLQLREQAQLAERSRHLREQQDLLLAQRGASLKRQQQQLRAIQRQLDEQEKIYRQNILNGERSGTISSMIKNEVKGQPGNKFSNDSLQDGSSSASSLRSRSSSSTVPRLAAEPTSPDFAMERTIGKKKKSDNSLGPLSHSSTDLVDFRDGQSARKVEGSNTRLDVFGLSTEDYNNGRVRIRGIGSSAIRNSNNGAYGRPLSPSNILRQPSSSSSSSSSALHSAKRTLPVMVSPLSSGASRIPGSSVTAASASEARGPRSMARSWAVALNSGTSDKMNDLNFNLGRGKLFGPRQPARSPLKDVSLNKSPMYYNVRDGISESTFARQRLNNRLLSNKNWPVGNTMKQQEASRHSASRYNSYLPRVADHKYPTVVRENRGFAASRSPSKIQESQIDNLEAFSSNIARPGSTSSTHFSHGVTSTGRSSAAIDGVTNKSPQRLSTLHQQRLQQQRLHRLQQLYPQNQLQLYPQSLQQQNPLQLQQNQPPRKQHQHHLQHLQPYQQHLQLHRLQQLQQQQQPQLSGRQLPQQQPQRTEKADSRSNRGSTKHVIDDIVVSASPPKRLFPGGPLRIGLDINVRHGVYPIESVKQT